MGEGLRNHYHQYYHYNTTEYYDKQLGVMVKKVTYRCMICGKMQHEKYQYRPPPKKHSKTKALQNNKKKRGNL